MFESKYGKILTIILVVIIVGIIILLSFLGYDVYRKFAIKKAAAEAVDAFNNSITDNQTNNEASNDVVTPILNAEITESTTATGKKVTYEGYNVVGTIEIPAIGLKYPVLENATADSIAISVAISCGPGLNQVGNTLIVGHNYRNGAFFGSNNKLKLGEKIYITDSTGQKITYNIYNIY